jgi:hypothetical protein
MFDHFYDPARARQLKDLLVRWEEMQNKMNLTSSVISNPKALQMKEKKSGSLIADIGK